MFTAGRQDALDEAEEATVSYFPKASVQAHGPEDSFVASVEHREPATARSRSSLWDDVFLVLSKTWKCCKALDGTLQLQQQPFDRFKELHPMHAIELLFWLLRSFGQVVFLNNPVSGALILIALFWENWFLGLCGTIASLVTTLTYTAAYSELGLLRNGLIGYNAVILGEGLAFFSGAERWLVVMVVVLCSIALTFVQVAIGKMLAQWNVPLLTFPFNFLLITTLAASFRFSYVPANNLMLVPTVTYPIDGVPFMETHVNVEKVFRGAALGVGQVFFVGTIGPSLLILLSSLLCSRVLAVSLYGGSLLGSALFIMFGADKYAVYSGLSGYNSCLTATAVVFFFEPSIATLLLAIVGVFVTVMVEAALISVFSTFGLPIGTLPFCIAATLVLMQESHWFRRIPPEHLSRPEDRITLPGWALRRLGMAGPTAAQVTPSVKPTVEVQLDDESAKDALIRSLEEAYNAPGDIDLDRLRALVSYDASLSGSDKELLLKSLEDCGHTDEDLADLRSQFSEDLEQIIFEKYA